MILVCFAIPQEARPFQSRAPEGVTVIVTGMGQAASEQAIERAINACRPEMVLTCGFAGGLNPVLAPMTVVYSATETPALSSKLDIAGAQPAIFCCSDRVMTTAAEKADARRQTGADAVEMESDHIRKVCARMGVPSATVRVILDPANADLPLNFNEVMGPDQRISPMKMAKYIAGNPGVIAGLLRLNRDSRQAANRLATVVAQVTSR